MPPEGLNFVGVFGLKLREVSHGSSLQVLEESLPCAEGCKPCSLFSLAVTPSPKFDDKVIQFDGTHYSGETSHALAGTVDVSHFFVIIVRFGPPPGSSRSASASSRVLNPGIEASSSSGSESSCSLTSTSVTW